MGNPIIAPRQICLVVLVLGLVACGGGGGDGGNGGGGGGRPDDGGGVEPSTNSAPQAQPFCNTVRQGSSLTGMLQASDPDGDPLSFSLDPQTPNVTGPVTTDTGTISLTDDRGTFTYKPNDPGARGPDTFRYRVDDAEGFDIAEVEIVVAPTIMPLGDSITRGALGGGITEETEGERVGYREPLYDSLRNAGFAVGTTPTFDFVGSDSMTGADVNDFDSDNEGHGGCTDEGIATGNDCANPAAYPGISRALEDNPADIVLLHIGTNGFQETTGGTQQILRLIRTWEDSGNNVTVVLARIIEDRDDSTNETAFNDNLARLFFDDISQLNYPVRVDPNDPNVVDGFPDDLGFPADIILVNQQAALDPNNDADYSSNLHPSRAGYTAMAEVWLEALTVDGIGPDILTGCPRPSP